MNKVNKKLKGNSLVYVLIIISIVGILLTSILQFVASQIKLSGHSVKKEEAFQVAEAGLYFYRWYLAHTVEGKTAQQVKDFWNGTPYGVDTPYEGQYKDAQGGNVIGTYRLEVTKPGPGSTIVIVKSTGWSNANPDVKRVIQARFRRPAWSEYITLSNSFIRFGATSEVYGKVFSNNGIQFDGVAHNIVMSHVTTYFDSATGLNKPGVWTSWASEYNTTKSSDVFLAGKRFPVAEKNFNSVNADLNLMKTEADTGNGVYFSNEGNGRHIILKPDGNFDVCRVQSFNNSNYNIINYRRTDGSGTCGTCSGACLSTYEIPNNSVIFVENNVWIEGTINERRVTIASANLISSNNYNVYIGKNNLKYTNNDGTDVLGIVSENNIEIMRDSQNNLELNGAFLAENGRVGRENYGSGDLKATLKVYGSIATYQQPVMAYGATHGYQSREYTFDNNLLYGPPPFFPTGEQYIMDLWDEL